MVELCRSVVFHNTELYLKIKIHDQMFASIFQSTHSPVAGFHIIEIVYSAWTLQWKQAPSEEN